MSKTPKKLKNDQIDKHFQEITDWKINSNKTILTKVIEFPSFVSGLAFTAKIAVYSEVLGHHPEVELTDHSVKIKLTTHSIKGLSKEDFELANKINNLRLQ